MSSDQGWENFPMPALDTSTGIHDDDDPVFTDSFEFPTRSGGATLVFEGDDWVDRPFLSLSEEVKSGDGTLVPVAFRLKERRETVFTNGLYQSLFNALENEGGSGERLSNEEWVIQRQRRESRLCHRHSQRERAELLASNGTQLVYREDCFQDLVAERRDQGNVLLLPSDLHIILPNLDDDVPAMPMRTRHRRYARHIRVSGETRRQQVRHFLTATMGLTSRYLQLPFLVAASIIVRDRTSQPSESSNENGGDEENQVGVGVAASMIVRDVIRQASSEEAFRGNGGDDESRSTQYWSTGTAVDNDWDWDLSSQNTIDQDVVTISNEPQQANGWADHPPRW